MLDFCRLENRKGTTINLIPKSLILLKTLSVVGSQLGKY